MAGVKGMKGGGGARPGAGRKKKPPVLVPSPAAPASPAAESIDGADPVPFLAATMNNANLDLRFRLDAAKALLSARRVAVADGGKKGAAKDAATKAGTGRFGPAAPPRLVSNSR
jgi:phage terminase small subunit